MNLTGNPHILCGGLKEPAALQSRVPGAASPSTLAAGRTGQRRALQALLKSFAVVLQSLAPPCPKRVDVHKARTHQDRPRLGELVSRLNQWTEYKFVPRSRSWQCSSRSFVMWARFSLRVSSQTRLPKIKELEEELGPAYRPRPARSRIVQPAD